MHYKREIDFENGVMYNCYRVTYPNGTYRLIYVTISKSNRTELIEWYNDRGWLITHNEYCT